MSLLNQINNFYIPSLKLTDIIEIIIFMFGTYKIVTGLKNTRAMILLKGIMALIIFYLIVYVLKFDAIMVLFEQFITFLTFAVVVVLQPELRKFIEQIGTKNIAKNFDIKSLFKKDKQETQKFFTDKAIDSLADACFAMGKVKTGALIVIQRKIPLNDYINTGISINGNLTSQLLINIFEKNTPLHDGAVIQIGDTVVSATCYLPLSDNNKIGKHMGTRHRAAIGISEICDCIVLVVSEETGSVSLAVDGKINYNLTREKMVSLMKKYQSEDKIGTSEVKKKKKFDMNQFGLNLLCGLIGILAWGLIINISDPITTDTFSNIPIEFKNTSVIESVGKTFELVSDDTVTVKVTAAKSTISSIDKDDITVVADMNTLSVVNAVSLYGNIAGHPEATVEIVGNDTVKIELDSIISKEFDVTINKTSKNTNTFVPELIPEHDSIIVSGGKKIIDTIDEIVFTYDTSNAKDTYTGTAKPVVYDRNGNVLDNSLFEFSFNELSVTGQVFNVKEVPIKISINQDFMNKYNVTSINMNPSTVKISGPDEQLDEIDTISVSGVSVALGINSTDMVSNNEIVKSLDISEYLPDGIYFAGNEDDEKISITITFEELKTKEITFSRDKVSFIGVSDGLLPSIKEDSFTIKIRGKDEVLSSINSENISPYVDVSSLGIGEYTLIIQFKDLNNVTLESNISGSVVISNIETKTAQ